MKNVEILKRLYKDYTRKFLSKIIIAFILSLILAGSTSSIAYLLDPAIEKIFLNKDKTLILLPNKFAKKLANGIIIIATSDNFQFW